MQRRPRRRAVGPPGAQPVPDVGLPPQEPFEAAGPTGAAGQDAADEERLRRERPPHHDREG